MLVFYLFHGFNYQHSTHRYYLSSKTDEDGDADGEALSNRYGNDAIVDLRTPRRVQSRRLLGALTFDVHAEMKSFHENPLRVWVRDVSLKCQNSTKSRFRKVLTSTFHLACVLVNSKTSSKRRVSLTRVTAHSRIRIRIILRITHYIYRHYHRMLRNTNIRDKKKNLALRALYDVIFAETRDTVILNFKVSCHIHDTVFSVLDVFQRITTCDFVIYSEKCRQRIIYT